MHTTFSPHTALRSLEAMHNHLQKQLTTIGQVSDLIPFIQHLMPLNNLKVQLSALLNQQYMKLNKQETLKHDKITNNIQHNNIRSLFISLHSLSGIPSDAIHAKIISFLPSIEYRKLPMLSTHFKHIMSTFPQIYNASQYQVKVHFKITNDSKPSQIYFDIDHRQQLLDIIAIDKQICDKPIYFPFHRINRWIFSKQGWSWNTPDKACFNDLVLDTIIKSKAIDCIHSLILERCAEKTLYHQFINKNIIFHNCIAATIDTSYIIPSMFPNLQCLELSQISIILDDKDENKIEELLSKDTIGLNKISKPSHMSVKEYYTSIVSQAKEVKIINILLQHLSATLRYFTYTQNENGHPVDGVTMDTVYKQLCGSIIMPEKLEWLAMKETICGIDLRECVNLIFLSITQDIEYDLVIWPDKQKYVIPFLYLGPKRSTYNNVNDGSVNESKWKNNLLNNRNDKMLPAVKFIYFGKLQDPDAFSWSSDKNVIYDDHKIVDIEDRKLDIDEKERYINLPTVLVNDVKCNNIKYKDLLCLMLNKIEIDNGLFDKIMNYVFNDNRNKINDKKEMYITWWILDIA
eukprot:140306_1